MKTIYSIYGIIISIIFSILLFPIIIMVSCAFVIGDIICSFINSVMVNPDCVTSNTCNLWSWYFYAIKQTYKNVKHDYFQRS